MLIRIDVCDLILTLRADYCTVSATFVVCRVAPDVPVIVIV
jgi:hypothetical protein